MRLFEDKVSILTLVTTAFVDLTEEDMIKVMSDHSDLIRSNQITLIVYFLISSPIRYDFLVFIVFFLILFKSEPLGFDSSVLLLVTKGKPCLRYKL